MADHAVSDSPAVQTQLDRLNSLSPGADVLGLERITQLMARLDNPHLKLPPVFHVAGTNGKGSTCAFLRAALEAEGYRVHVYTSPHLARFNERIRVAGTLISDEYLAELLERVLNVGEDVGASFFEVTTAAAFLAFSETPAEACVIEVGLGGRLDATNVIPNPAVCGIAQLGLDHQGFLGDTIEQIAGEKAGIAKGGAPLVTMTYPANLHPAIRAAAERAGTRWQPKGGDWDALVYNNKLHYRDEAGKVEAALPRLSGPHQPMNLALAIAMLRHQHAVKVGEAAIHAAPLWAHWPARLQRLDRGPLLTPLPDAAEVWLDGGHNPAAGEMLGAHFRAKAGEGQPLDLVIGMLANKDPEGFLEPLRGLVRSVHVLPVPGHEHHGPDRFAPIIKAWGVPMHVHATPAEAIAAIAANGDTAPRILMTGTLYLAGVILRENDQLPD